MLFAFNFNFKDFLSELYKLGFNKTDYPIEVSEYSFKSDGEALELYKQIREDEHFDFSYSYVSSYNPINKQITYDSDIACEYSLRLKGVAKQSVFEVAITRSVMMWVIQCLPYKDGSIWQDQNFIKVEKEQKDVQIVMSQILIWHAIKNDLYFLKAFDVLNSKQSKTYRVYEHLKARELRDITKDLVELRKMKNYSLGKWSKMIGLEELKSI